MTRAHEVVVGAVIILAVIVVATGTLFLKGFQWGADLTYVDALSRDVGQLMEGNDVKFRGVTIGTVNRISVEPGGDAVRVSLELDGDVEVAPDAVVIIAPESLFGDWQAEIVTRSRFPRFDYYEVQEGRTNEEGERVLGGYALPDISRLTASADEIAENLRRLTDRVDRAFTEETADNLRLAINNIQQVSEEIANLIDQQASTFESVSSEVERAATEIGQAATTARSTLAHADRILGSGEVDTLLLNLRTLSVDLQRIAGNVDTTTVEFSRTMARVDSTLTNVQDITSMIEEGRGSLGMFIGDTVLYARAQQSFAQLDSLLADIRENPRRYINLSIF